MRRFEHAVLASVLSTTFAIGGCAADDPNLGENEAVVENQDAVEHATDDALRRWGLEDLEDAEDASDASRCAYDDDPQCKDDKPEVDCKDPKHACDPRCKDRKVCVFKSILVEKHWGKKNRDLAIGAALFKYDEKASSVDYLLYVLTGEDVTSAALFLGDHDKDKGKNRRPVAILAKPAHDLESFQGFVLSGSIRSDDLTGPFKGEPIETLVDAMKADDIYLGVSTHHDKKRKSDLRGRVKLVKCKKLRKPDHDRKDGKDSDACHRCGDRKHEDGKRDHNGKHDDCKDPKDHDGREECKDSKDHDGRKECKDPKDHDCKDPKHHDGRKECKDPKDRDRKDPKGHDRGD